MGSRSSGGERVRDCLERWADLLRVKKLGRLPKRPWAALVVGSWSPMVARCPPGWDVIVGGDQGLAGRRLCMLPCRKESRLRVAVQTRRKECKGVRAHWNIYQAHCTRQKMTRGRLAAFLDAIERQWQLKLQLRRRNAAGAREPMARADLGKPT